MAFFVLACSNDAAEPPTLDDPAEYVSERLNAEENAPPNQTTSSSANDDGQTDTTIPQIRGAVVNQYSLTVGDCFNRLESLQAGKSVVITSLINCDLPHDHQIYFTLNYPAPHPSIYPGDDIMEDFAVQSCYREFEFWVGSSYELSELGIGVITPNKTNFESDNTRYRQIHCWVERFDGEALVGNAHQSGW